LISEERLETASDGCQRWFSHPLSLTFDAQDEGDLYFSGLVEAFFKRGIFPEELRPRNRVATERQPFEFVSQVIREYLQTSTVARSDLRLISIRSPANKPLLLPSR
jgi:hypothetical protein